jgi:hypothetical protein
MPTYTTLRGPASVTDKLLSEQLEANLKMFLDWALLGLGGFADVKLPAAPTTTAGGHRLRLSDDTRFAQGRAWEGFRKDWVWETGVGGSREPVHVSGVWVNGAFKVTGATGTYAHVIDYPQGRIIFDSPVPTGTHVAAEYSYRRYQVYADHPDWFRKVQMEADWADPAFLQPPGSGAYSEMADARVQTPAVVLRAMAGVRHEPYEMGNLTQKTTQAVALDVLGDAPGSVGWMHDALVGQEEHSLRLFDLNAVLRADAWPLDPSGMRRAGAKMYPALVAETGLGGYLWRQCRVASTDSQERMSRPPLRHAAVLWKCQVVLP